VVEAAKVDDLVKRRVDFCKIDVEGHEPSVIKGMTRILRRDRPIILTEFNQYWLGEAGSSIADYGGLLKSFGYKLWKVGATVIPFDETERFEPLANFNVLAVPGEVALAESASEWA